MEKSLDTLQDLTKPQKSVLEAVAGDTYLADTFYFTGGTLLKALGIVPRQSNDLDLFTFHTVTSLFFTQQLVRLHTILDKLFGKNNIILTDKGFLHKPSGMTIDAVHDGIKNIDNFIPYGTLQTAGLKDLIAGKASALCSRDEVKDYVDIAFLSHHTKYTLADFATIAEEKFQLNTISEEKLLTELLAKRKMFDVQSDIFLRDKEENMNLLDKEINRLINSTTI